MSRRPAHAGPLPEDGELDRMSDTELAELEDRLLLELETDGSKEARMTVGRAVIYALTLALWGILLLAMARFVPTERLGPINIVPYVGSLFVAVVAGEWLWRAAGREVRGAVRWAIGHWPIALYAGAVVYRLVR